jgi:hypothetical protein
LLWLLPRINLSGWILVSSSVSRACFSAIWQGFFLCELLTKPFVFSSR